MFGSEQKAVLAHPSVRAGIDLGRAASLPQCQFIPAPHCVFDGVRKLMPGHAIRLRARARSTYARIGVPTIRASSTSAGGGRGRRARPRAAAIGRGHAGRRRPARRVRERRCGLVARRRGDDRPHRRADRHVQHRIRGGVAVSEHEEAARVAGAHRQPPSRAHAVARPRARRVRPLDRRLRRALRADQAALPTMLLAGFARRDVTVVLTGEGADGVRRLLELQEARARGRFTRWLGHSASPLPALVRGLPPAWRKDRLLRSVTEPLERRYRTIPNVFDVVLHGGLLSPRFLEATARTRHQRDRGRGVRSRRRALPRPPAARGHRLWLPDDLPPRSTERR